MDALQVPAAGPVLARIASVNVGLPKEARLPAGFLAPEAPEGRYRTAIAKSPQTGPVHVRELGLDGDRQEDTRNHGGPDKAVCAHFAGHLAWWGRHRGLPPDPGEIGENLTLIADPQGPPEPSEADLCIGDILGAGSALLQVSGPRIPCYKQAAALRVADGVRLAGQTGRTGLYLRVLRTGDLQAGDRLVLLQRPNPGVTVTDANRFIHQDRHDPELRRRLGACTALGEEIRRRLGPAT